MRVANIAGRAALLVGDRAVDLAKASAGRFGPDPQSVYDVWGELTAWASALDLTAQDSFAVVAADVAAPVPAPRQVFAIGLNYDAHAQESGFVRPSAPVVFTKFVSSLSGPVTEVELPSATVDWEVELVVVIGRPARSVRAADAWSVVAGLTLGQDLSERTSQHAGPAPQFSLAKSFPGFSPLGAAVVTVDELADPDDLEIECRIDGRQVQSGRTSQMIFSVPELIAHLSAVLPLYPGDLIFTGTPAGVGAGRTPPRYLRAGETLTSSITGLGELHQTFVAGTRS